MNQGISIATASLWQQPVPQLQQVSERLAFRALCWLCKRLIVNVSGPLANLRRRQVIVVMNHNQRLEGPLLSAFFSFVRGGDSIRFMADWQLVCVPGLGRLLKHQNAIIVGKKSHRWTWLNRWRPKNQAYHEARERLGLGESLALFPEGKMNRDPNLLLPGKLGAARLAIESGCPVLPLGIRFPNLPPNKMVGDIARMSLHFGELLHPPPQVDSAEAWPFHVQIMTEIARLSGKKWPFPARGGINGNPE